MSEEENESPGQAAIDPRRRSQTEMAASQSDADEKEQHRHLAGDDLARRRLAAPDLRPPADTAQGDENQGKDNEGAAQWIRWRQGQPEVGQHRQNERCRQRTDVAHQRCSSR